MIAAKVFERNTRIGLPKNRDDLRLAESGLLQKTSWLQDVPESSTFYLSLIQGSFRPCLMYSQNWISDATGL